MISPLPPRQLPPMLPPQVRRVVELNVIEQCLNIYKTGVVQRRRLLTSSVKCAGGGAEPGNPIPQPPQTPLHLYSTPTSSSHLTTNHQPSTPPPPRLQTPNPTPPAPNPHQVDVPATPRARSRVQPAGRAAQAVGPRYAQAATTPMQTLSRLQPCVLRAARS